MKILAVILIVLALVIGIAPQFTNCDYARAMTGMSPSASTTPAAKPICLWTARAELAVAVPLLAMGLLLFFARRKESKRALSILAVLEGVFAILLPVVLIGVCSSATMKCRTTMEPILYVAGALVIVVGLAALAWNEWRREA
jgi:hypothetical protein